MNLPRSQSVCARQRVCVTDNDRCSTELTSGFLLVCKDDPDYADACPEHAAIENYCKDQEAFMKKHCRKSCGLCSEGDGDNFFPFSVMFVLLFVFIYKPTKRITTYQ